MGSAHVSMASTVTVAMAAAARWVMEKGSVGPGRGGGVWFAIAPCQLSTTGLFVGLNL
jgi:hypothetical protein